MLPIGARFAAIVAMAFGLAGCPGGSGSSDATIDGSTTSGDTSGDASGDATGPCTDGQTTCSDDSLSVLTCAAAEFGSPTACEFGCIDGACLTEAVPGTCPTPLELTLDQPVTETTDKPFSLHEWSTACTTLNPPFTPTGPEAVFRLSVPDAGSVDFTLDAVDDTFFGLYLRSACTNVGTELTRSCVDVETSGGEASLSYLLPAGEYFVFVDDFGLDGNGTGEFTLTATQSPLPSCVGQVPMLLDVTSGTASVMGDTANGNSGTSWNFGTCPSSFETRGNELIYAFTVLEESTVQILATPLEPSDSSIALYVRDECEDRFQQPLCALGQEGVAASLDEVLPAGTYYIFVDDFADSVDDPQTFTLDVQVTPVTP